MTRAAFSRRFSASQPLSIICSSARALTTAVLRTARRSFSTARAPSSAANFPSQRRHQAAAASVVCEPGRGVEDVRNAVLTRSDVGVFFNHVHSRLRWP